MFLGNSSSTNPSFTAESNHSFSFVNGSESSMNHTFRMVDNDEEDNVYEKPLSWFSQSTDDFELQHQFFH